MAVNARREKSLERKGPSVMDTSISPCASLVEANSKMIALTKVAPRRKSALATATAAYEHDELAAPRPHASTKPFKSGLPRALVTARFETTVWIMAEIRNPRARGQRTSQSMKNEICRACRIALTTNNPA